LLLNKLIILFFAVFLCVVLIVMSPIMAFKAMSTNRAQSQQMILGVITIIMALVSGFGSLLAAWSAADAVASEMKSGTVMAIMARPVERWEFLAGKYLGVQMLMAIYVVFMFAVTNILAWIGGERLVTNPWVLFVYPMVRYGIYSAISILLVTVMHPIFAFAAVLFSSVLANMVAPSAGGASFLPEWLRHGLFFALPSVNLLSESNFLAITSATLKQTSWSQHFTALAYGLDYAALCLLLAAWSFRRRSLARD
jgi:ABC-type transport system involved in multi-copper enzyme maturation permease subunit